MKSDEHIRTLSLTFDKGVYSLTAVKKSAYRYLHAFTTDISIVEGTICCVLNFVSSVNEADAVRLSNELKKEVLDQDLREKLHAETEAVRNVILAHAFSQTGLVNNEPFPGN